MGQVWPPDLMRLPSKVWKMVSNLELMPNPSFVQKPLRPKMTLRMPDVRLLNHHKQPEPSFQVPRQLLPLLQLKKDGKIQFDGKNLRFGNSISFITPIALT